MMMPNKRDMINRLKEQTTSSSISNLSQSTLDSMAETKRKVDAGLLPKYIGGPTTTDNIEIEKQAERVYKFTHILGNRKSRNEY